MSLGQILFVVLTLFASSLMFFYLGAKFGPQILNLNESRARLKESFLPNDELAVEIKSLLTNAETEFSFFDVVQNKKPFPSVGSKKQDLKQISMIQEKAAEESVKVEEPKSNAEELKAKKEEEMKLAEKQKKLDADKKKIEAKKVAKKQPEKKPTPPKKVEVKEKKPQSLATLTEKLEKTPQEEIKEEANKTRYLLQVGSFSSLKKAQKQQEVWQSRGYKPTVVVANIPGKGKWYRLRLGLYNDYESIQMQQKKIMQRYKQTAMILPIQ